MGKITAWACVAFTSLQKVFADGDFVRIVDVEARGAFIASTCNNQSVAVNWSI